MLQKYSKKQEEQEHQQSLQSSRYELSGSRYIGKDSYCLCMAFKGTDILAVGQIRGLKIFRLNSSDLHLEQTFKRTTVLILIFSKTKFELFVGCLHGELEIFEKGSDQKWNVKFFLNEAHTCHINTLIMNKSEDLIITCGHDSVINFWKYKDSLEIQQRWQSRRTILNGVCLNESENQIIFQSMDQLIISEVGQDGIWKKKQRIQMGNYGKRFCYIGDNLITFQLKNQILSFELDLRNQLFGFAEKIQMENKTEKYQEYFRQIFNQKKQILFTRNYKSILLFEKNNKNQFIHKQTINFHNEHVQIAVSDNGEYLAAWNPQTYTLEMRKYIDY